MTNADLVKHTSAQEVTRKQQQILLSKFNNIKVNDIQKIQVNCKLNCWRRYKFSDGFILQGRNTFCVAVGCTSSHLHLCCIRLYKQPSTSVLQETIQVAIYMCCSRLYGQPSMSVASDMRKLTHLRMMVDIDSSQMCPCMDDKHYPALLQYVALPTSKWSCCQT